MTLQGVKLIFFSNSQLAPKFFKVVANLKKSWSPFFKTKKTFFYAVSFLDRPSKIKLGKRYLTCAKQTLGWMTYNFKAHLDPRWCLVINQDAMCRVFETNLTRKFAVDLSFNSLYL